MHTHTTYCPDCGFTQSATNIGDALNKANEHNASCGERIRRVKEAEKAKRFPVPRPVLEEVRE